MKTKVIMQLDKVAKYIDGEMNLVFSTDDMRFQNWLDALSQGERYSLVISDVERDRTLDQNALLWALINDICQSENAQTTNKWDMYCYLLRLSKAKYTYVSIVEDGLEAFKRAHGVRAVEVVGNETRENGKKFVNCCVYLGSSQMTTKEMSKLIDVTIEYAEHLGIDTHYYREMLEG